MSVRPFPFQVWGEDLQAGPLPRTNIEEAERATRQLDDQVHRQIDRKRLDRQIVENLYVDGNKEMMRGSGAVNYAFTQSFKCDLSFPSFYKLWVLK